MTEHVQFRLIHSSPWVTVGYGDSAFNYGYCGDSAYTIMAADAYGSYKVHEATQLQNELRRRNNKK
ncbi:hypothetical protein JCM17960_32240 [Magnetospira thiophila]